MRKLVFTMLLFGLLVIQGCLLMSNKYYETQQVMWKSKAEVSKAWAAKSNQPLATFRATSGELFTVSNPHPQAPMPIMGEPSAIVQGLNAVLNSSVAKIVGGGWAAGYLLGKVQGNVNNSDNRINNSDNRKDNSNSSDNSIILKDSKNSDSSDSSDNRIDSSDNRIDRSNSSDNSDSSNNSDNRIDRSDSSNNSDNSIDNSDNSDSSDNRIDESDNSDNSNNSDNRSNYSNQTADPTVVEQPPYNDPVTVVQPVIVNTP